jgi:DNA processing protein
VVGTRRPTPYGLAVAERLSGDLAHAGLTIVSGMARGVDTAAHKGALAAGGDTVAVLGCGVDVVYPAENRKLAAELAVKGLIVSEFPMGATAFPQNFPIRNRIISGISLGVLVVEGAQYSGSAITAKLAMDQGREVFAVPGNITNKLAWGPNLLIKQGAKLVQDWNDVVSELPAESRRHLIDRGRQGSSGRRVHPAPGKRHPY